MVDIALKMLFGDRARYAMLISGIAFATILMTQGFALFFGILSFSYATLANVRAPIWVFDPLVQQIADNQPLRDTDVDRVRSVEGVAWAAPLYIGGATAKLLGDGGSSQQVTLIGIDANTLVGAPNTLLSGNVLDLRMAESVIVDANFILQVKALRGKELKLGDIFEMNDRRARIVGVASLSQGIVGATSIYTTWDRAKDYAPSQRKMLTHVLAAPQVGLSTPEVCRAITQATGLKAVSEAEFKHMSELFMLKYSPIPFVVGLIVVIGFVIGVAISGQTFYAFVLENTRYLGALKAMGSSNGTLAAMILVQALIVGLTGFGLGVGVMSAFFAALPVGRVPLLLLWPVPVCVLCAVLFICMGAALLSVLRVSRIEPAIVFRS
ncbi:MAG: ABC transporter permease [Opitutus sp.]|nr:ABC transporter permease [Opitutus sp.]MCS6247610.1 ABC transporter permease [Opitutus sp.]MCS6273975.1 ABC transporter permease [Opitutus sp.]MCS6277707.1 ABC transporter permease [Opitutus sp.]MCS6299188.1 ABC transporter permease [Opitutus sp.]